MASSELNLVMTAIGFAVSATFIVFVCTRLIWARILLYTTRRSVAITSGSDLSILERGCHGLDPFVISKFPMKKYSDAFFTSIEDAQCTVCLADYHSEDTIRIMPLCGHYFHRTCIDIWLQRHSTCPICRISLRESTEKRGCMQPMFSSAVRSQRHVLSMFGSSRTHGRRTMDPSPEECHQSESGRIGGGENKRAESPSIGCPA